MENFTDFELTVMREAISNYEAGLKKAKTQVNAVRKIENEMRRRGLIKPMKAVQDILGRTTYF